MKLSTIRFFNWLRVILWTGIIFATLPYARTWTDWITQRFSGYFIPAIVYAILLYFLIYTIVWMIKSRSSRADYVLLIIVTAGYLYSLLKITIIIEQVHFIEYGILAYFFLKAIRHYRSDAGVYLIAAFAVTLVGIIDEIIQGFLPDRVGELHDVYLNIISGLLALCWYRITLKPSETTGHFTTAWIAALPIFGVILILIGFFNSYFSDFGYLIKDEEIGAFYSRRHPSQPPPDSLLIAGFRNNVLPQLYQTHYSILLKSVEHTLAEETLVHIFRRDRHLRDKDFITVHRENQILEKYFQPFIAGTDHQWPPEKVEQLKTVVKEQLNEPYVSPVAEHLITSFSERAQWIFIALLEIAIIVVIVIIKRVG